MRRSREIGLGAALAIALGVTACKRSSGPPAPAASAPDPSAGTTDLPVASAPPPGLAAASDEPPFTGEAARGRLRGAGTDPVLSPHAKLIEQHFGGAGRSLAFQTTPLSEGRRLVLLYEETGAPDPLLLDIDAKRALVWEKSRPLAGIGASSDRMAITGGPGGNVVFFFYDAPTHLVGMRVWDSAGGILMDAEVMTAARCDALSALYWQDRGFIVAAASPDSVRVELVGIEGRNRWGGREMALARWRATAPASLMADTNDSFMLFQVGYLAATPGAESPDHLFAMRYDAAGLPLWPGPLDTGRLPGRVEAAADRPRLSRPDTGIVRAELPGTHFSVQVTSMGKSTRN